MGLRELSRQRKGSGTDSVSCRLNEAVDVSAAFSEIPFRAEVLYPAALSRIALKRRSAGHVRLLTR
jgi:hypothetical protein